MIRYIKTKLSLKIFLITTLLLMGISGATYAFVANFMPVIYSESLNRALAERAEKLAESLESYTLEASYSLLGDFSRVYQSGLILLDAQGGIIYADYGTAETSDAELGYDEAVSENTAVQGQAAWDFGSETDASTESVDDTVFEAEVGQASEDITVVAEDASGSYVEAQLEQQAMGRYPVTFKGNDNEYTLFVFGSTEQVNQAIAALKRILPWLLLTIFCVSVLVSLFYSGYLTKPVVSLSKTSSLMAELDFSTPSALDRWDEIGILSRSLDTLAEKLDCALTDLQNANAQLKSDMEFERAQERKRMDFFAAASHELKTPVTILKGQLEGMIQGVGVYRDRDKYLLRAREVTGTMETMVQEILTVSRMESQNFSLQKKNTDLAELIRIQLADLNELFEKKNMNMEINLPDALRRNIDPALMTTVIRNLLTNAVRYSPEKARISVGLHQEGTEAVMRVENSGVWIPREDLSKVFDAFYRVDTSRNRKSGGSGLGLYIVREILEQHGAAYEIENTASGVQFTVRLPGDDRVTLGSSTQNT